MCITGITSLAIAFQQRPVPMEIVISKTVENEVRFFLCFVVFVLPNRMRFLYIFSQQSPVISGSFAKIDLQFKDVLRHPMGLLHPVMRCSRYRLLHLECH